MAYFSKNTSLQIGISAALAWGMMLGVLANTLGGVLIRCNRTQP